MSQDEFIAFLLGLFATGWFGFAWYSRLHVAGAVTPAPDWFRWLRYAPPLVLAGIFAVLKTLASYDVRDAPQYLILYTLLGGAWVLVGAQLFAGWGVSFRDDAVERRNAAAGIAIGCALVAHAAIYSGANVGDGPGWWVVVIAGGLGLAGWLALWWVVEKFCAASEQITIERDVPAAVRFGGYMIGSGLIFGRAVAGDWVALPNTIADMWVAWPAVTLTALIVVTERWRRGQTTSLNTSIAFAVLCVAAGAATIALSPPLSHNPVYGPP